MKNSKVKHYDSIILSKKEIMKIFDDVFLPGETVYIKIHFGEPGNKTAFTPKIIKPYTDALHELGFETVLWDTPVLYDSLRNTKKGYEKVVLDKCFNKISKTEICDDYESVKLHDGTVAEIAKLLVDVKNLLVLTHVKGHQVAGFGGSIKNIGIGAMSPKTKALVHEVEGPDDEYGFNQDRLGEVVAAALEKMPKNKLFINIIRDVTRSCDCDSDPDNPIIAPNLGVLVSDDLVAIDQASLDLVNKSKTDVFIEATGVNPQAHVDSTAKYSKK